MYNDRVDTHFEEGQSLDDVKDRLKQCLELPVKFRFKKCGVEKKLIAESIAPEWCVNVQRAVINHLYLPIKNNNEDYQIRLNEVRLVCILTDFFSCLFSEIVVSIYYFIVSLSVRCVA